ncbi:3'(2'),5'-bisphosphate nucleotidase CysQ [Acidaminobacter sp. JC074]|uniref:3'(2'),5'-bisphosphate nucleotidase CysQ n=1 Tax=Acidaminobacter sp. JC074 TaxID=2530199 RepID=UPI001F0DC25A|nr:3'(2'),5'-bisphosphate nucleotidase CysQ [Acidaminobacter sp. JC074]MCH4886813.1 3'(2'),5'-bisphosphate nucleotidase CysQ [Acidaminobacter sp. JC074]
MYEKALSVAKEAAIEAGKVIMQYYKSSYEVDIKEDDSPLTCADKAADEVIEKMIRDAFPDDAILSEESVDDMSRLEETYVWVIDPMDGTKEFINHTDEFTVNIALVKDGHPVIGVIYVPVTREMYYAYKGQGSFYEHDGVITKNQVSDRKENLRLVSSKFHKSEAFLDFVEKHAKDISAVESVGSSLKGCMIARGLAEAYFRFGYTSEWDTAAQQIIAEEAGGYFMQLDHTVMTYNRKDVLNRKGFYIVNNANSILLG